MIYTDKSGFGGKVQAAGGTNAVNLRLAQGGAGTVFWKKASDPYGELVIDNGGNDSADWSTPLQDLGILRLKSLVVSGNARFSTPSGLRAVNGNPAAFAGLISSNYLQVGGLLVSNTWVYGDGWLTCLDVMTGQFWQANRHGEFRTSWLGEPEEGEEFA